MERYRHQYPDADIVLFEPRRDDREMFFTNVFSYADRRRLCEHAYQQTREDLRRAAALEPILARHGLSLDETVLRDRAGRFFRACRSLLVSMPSCRAFRKLWGALSPFCTLKRNRLRSLQARA